MGKKPRKIARKTSRKTGEKRPFKRTTVGSKAAVHVAKLARFEVQGEPLRRTLRAGSGPRRMRKDQKAKLLSTDAAKVVPKQIWDYAFLTARRPWIDNVARLAVVHASMRSTPDDFLLSASDGDYHTPYVGVYFRAPEANVPILVNFLVTALASQLVDVAAPGIKQRIRLSAGSHHVPAVVVPTKANLYHVTLETFSGDPSRSMLELEGVELTTLA